MMHVKKIVAVLDANVLYPAPLRDFLLRLAQTDVFTPKWSGLIQEEWIRNLLINRVDLKKSQLNKTRHAMDSAFPEANVVGFKNLIPALTLPDADDRHVLAAAIKSEADMIVTFNKKDFPPKSMQPYSIRIADPDEFVMQLTRAHFPDVLQAFLIQVNALKNPPQTTAQLLVTLENCGLKESAAAISNVLHPGMMK